VEDPILYWNAVALEVHRRDYAACGCADHDDPDLSIERSVRPEQEGATRESRVLAMVHLAAYDAWRAHKPTIGQPYLNDYGAPKLSSSPEAAVSSAAASVLKGLYPQRLPLHRRAGSGVVGDARL
jgi:hypothetical protein